MALRERKDCTEEGLVPRADAIHSSLRPSSTQRRMSSTNFLSETLWFIPTRRPTVPYFGSGLAGGTPWALLWHTRAGHSTAEQQLDAANYIPPPGSACTTSRDGSKDTNRFQAHYRPEHDAPSQGLQRGSGQLSALILPSERKGHTGNYFALTEF